MHINFTFGQVLGFDALNPNTIALDGAVQGPQIDAGSRRFSFDHHAGCTRLVTLATCQQVATALQLGLVVDEETIVVINDIDADTVLAVWLLANPERVNEEKVKELVERVGLTDAHGPIFVPHDIHRELAPAYGSKEPQTMAMLETFLAKVSQYANGEWQAPPARAERPSKGYAWSPSGWVAIETKTGFNSVYEEGYLAGFLFTEAPQGTYLYTVAKRSDLVPMSMGPGAVVRPPKSSDDYRKDTILGALALKEIEVNPDQSHAANWGGASSIGGGPRNPDGTMSRLTPEQVLEVCKTFTGGR